MFSTLNKFKQLIAFQVFTIYLRYLIGAAFVMAAFGMGKVNGNSNLLQSMNSPIEQLQPIQQFFRVMADSGMYWQFIGWSQIIAGALLMTQRLARLGAIIFFGLILNIFVITISYGFSGTPIITGLMLLASIYLLAWDLPAYMPMLRNNFIYKKPALQLADHPVWGILGAIMLTTIFTMALLQVNIVAQLIVVFAEGLAGFVLYFIAIKKREGGGSTMLQKMCSRI